MLNLTDMWRAAGSDPSKRPVEWLRQSASKELAEHVKSMVGIAHHEIIQTDRGGSDPGTWAHWHLGLSYARYLSPEFEVWCNEVVRAHMERRNLPVEAVRGAITLSEADLDRFAAKVGEGAILAARKFLSDDVAKQVDPINSRLERLERKFDAVVAKRRHLTEATKRQHIEDATDLGGRCPCCGVAQVVVDGQRSRFAEFDHFYANHQPSADHTWLICSPCHAGLTSGRTPRDTRQTEFETYQKQRRRLPGRQQTMFA